MPVREVSPELRSALRAVQHVEDVADPIGQRRRAITATSTLLWAAVCAGWRIVDVAPAAGLRVKTASERIAKARRRHAGHPPPGIEVEPPSRPVTVASILAAPLAERQWLTTTEAMAFADITLGGIRQWLHGGLLPNTDRSHHGCVLFLRADLERVMRAPRHRNGGVDWKKLRTQIEAAKA